MAEEYLQVAFEIKAMCDELSRRLLRWHWEQQEGKTLPQLAEYVAQRAQQAPDYYSRMPELAGLRDWQKLDTTVCMRVLLDPGEGDGGEPLRLLSAAPRPVAARHACNGLRVARNAAAHATELAGAAEAAACFSETVEDLADSYGEAVFTAAELQKYRKAAARAVDRCAKAAHSRQTEVQFAENEPELPLASAPGRTAAQPGKSKTEPRNQSASQRRAAASEDATAKSKPVEKNKRAASADGTKRSTGNTGAAAGRTGRSGTAAKRGAAARRRTSVRGRKSPDGVQLLFLALGAAVLLGALYLRAKSLGILP